MKVLIVEDRVDPHTIVLREQLRFEPAPAIPSQSYPISISDGCTSGEILSRPTPPRRGRAPFLKFIYGRRRSIPQ
jgi:hypothetical protein